ncbi:S-adenosyl-l-methionine hydroxide adenosyltransferase family protein [Candidatus Bathyarchaeota archaeon]|nr:S-adenosyl-l-methionine hydroxide adenosyltransferase family protein [Candidatus Bathyarchaeota archaeon]
MKRKPVITLLSDFGLKDPYVAEMKAVILSICPEASIVDISHEVNKYDKRIGAYMLARAAPLFPKGTIHVAVVDPEVGTKRKPIIITTKHHLYVGPDNGLLILSAEKEGIGKVYEITNKNYMLRNISRTFHGRDIFSPAAAYLALGISASDFGPEISEIIKPSFSQPKVRGQEVLGEVLHVDKFGNIVTNISSEHLKRIGVKEEETLTIMLKNSKIAMKWCSSYSEVPIGTPLLIEGSGGFLEVAVNQGDASKLLGAKSGDKIVLRVQE